ncbi:MAG: carbohydrate kinase [Planctomycetes bacterium]|nr:carbohydrate kinase [Planctomycetota bacterium]
MQLDRLKSILNQFPRQRIAVLGDFFLDKYLEIDPALAEPSLETGRVAHQVIGVRRSPGAAGTVVNNLAALGTGQLHAVGAVGDDGEAFDLCQGLNRLGCSTDSLLRCPELLTPTYLKPCDANVVGLAGEHSRYDTKNRRPTPTAIVERICDELEQILPKVDALIVMDQVELPDCGVVTAAVRNRLAELALKYPKVLFWADSRRFIRLYRNVMIKANQFEAVHRLNPAVGEEVSLEELREVVPQLRSEMAATVFVTCAERGILTSDPEVTLVAGVKVTGPIDPTGAGDSATAGAVLSLASGATPAEAALVANLVASTTVRQLGTTGTASPAQVCDALAEWTRQQAG